MRAPKIRAYFNHAGLARPSERAMKRVREIDRQYAELLFSDAGIEFYQATLRECRAAAATLLHTEKSEGGISLLSNSSTALNLAISILGGAIKPGEIVLTSDQEHPCVRLPLARLEKLGAEIATISARSPGEFLEKTRSVVKRRPPALAVLSHVSYLNGRLLPVGEAGQIFAECGTPYLIDGAQALGHVSVDVTGTKAWAYAFTGHKWLCGPMGTGGLWTSAEFLGRNPLAWAGGDEVNGAGPLENGTLNCALFAGLAEACRARHEEFSWCVGRLQQLNQQIAPQLDAIYPGARATWDGPHAPGILSYSLAGASSGTALSQAAQDGHGVAIKPFYSEKEPDGFRISYSPWTGEHEVELLLEAMRGLAGARCGSA
jgi:L-cysteine/cystine lyase